MPTSSSDFLRAVQQTLGNEAVDRSESILTRYGRNRLPEGDRRPSGVVCPRSAAEVQTIVQLANESKTSLYSTSTGENSGLGLKSPVRPGSVIVDVGARTVLGSNL
jgi:4-cresol dehydrogenase (hydroxylating)